MLSRPGAGTKWVTMLFWLLVYAMLLMPGFIQVGLFYFLSRRVRRSIVYGPNPRNRLDLYFPTSAQGRDDGHGARPVVIFITGGAWIIGYKAWGALLGKVLSKEGVIVASLDYRNFPQGRLGEMLEDVHLGIAWVVRHIHEHGGDPANVYLVGQSAGAHLASMAIIESAERSAFGEGPASPAAPGMIPAPGSWTPSQVRGFIGVSGAYDIVDLVEHFNARGLYRQLLEAIMAVKGRTSLEAISPAFRISKYVKSPAQYAPVVSAFPPILLLHGKDDKSIPYQHAVQFGQVLESAGIPHEIRLYDGETHTTPLIENPMRGSNDKLSEGVLDVIMPNRPGGLESRRLVPEVLIKLALSASPF